MVSRGIFYKGFWLAVNLTLIMNVLDSWLAHRNSRQSCACVLDQFRCFVGVDGFEGLLEVEDPRGFVLRWRDTLDVAPKSLNVYMSLVKGFYRHFDVDLGVLPRLRGRVLYPHKVLTLEEIRRMVDFADIRMKALILFLYNSGARISSALGLNYGRVDWRGDPPLRVHFYPGETKFEVEYDTFIGVECVGAFQDYFRWRRRRGDKLRTDSPLFVTKYRGRLSYQGSRSAVKVIIAKAGIKINPNERLTHHSFRGAFQQNLQRAGVNQYIIEKLIGHYTENKTVGRYSLGITLEDLREAYNMADWGLGVDEVKVRELEETLDDTKRILGEEVLRQNHRDTEIQELRKMVVELQEEREKLVQIQADEIYRRLLARMEKNGTVY